MVFLTLLIKGKRRSAEEKGKEKEETGEKIEQQNRKGGRKGGRKKEKRKEMRDKEGGRFIKHYICAWQYRTSSFGLFLLIISRKDPLAYLSFSLQDGLRVAIYLLNVPEDGIHIAKENTLPLERV